VRPRSEGPPSDAGLRAALVTRTGATFPFVETSLSIGSTPDDELQVESKSSISRRFGLTRRAGRWVGVLTDPAAPDDERRPRVVHDGEEFTVGLTPLRLVLPRPLPSPESRTEETASVLRVCYVAGDWTYVDKEEFVIGRSRQCDLTVTCPSVSRRHCRIIRRGDKWLIEDLESASGLWRGEDPLVEPEPIQHGDRFRIGDQTLQFELKI
jgi:hypothetical protein